MNEGIIDNNDSQFDASFVGKLGGEDIILPGTKERLYPLRAHFWPTTAPFKGYFLILPGFTEFCEKYALTARRLVKQGYSCLIIDWPGQGRSGHLGNLPELVHCTHFNQHMEALELLLAQAGFLEKQFHVLGHSMGGYFALRTAHLYHQQVGAAILLSPMIVPLSPPIWFTRALARLLISFGYSDKLVPFGRISPLAEARRFRLDNVLTRYPEGYDRQYQIFVKHPELRRFRPSVGWISAAFDACKQTSLNPEWMAQISCPVLTLLAADERVVNLVRAKQMLRHLPNHKQVLFPDARHELLNELPETVRRLFAEIDEFLPELEELPDSVY
ncbi:MAG: alpha/beta hydrolase [Alphaproteobacteria bacterium]|nr:alpha/beta hydrolase [Alphaproteobacteria bacterium]